MMIDFMTMGFLALAGFIAAFVDCVVGGGGLISLPALLMAGLPPTAALGTNKVAASFSSLASTAAFVRSGKVEVALVKRLVPVTFVGAVAGAGCVQFIPSSFLKPMVVVMLGLVAVYTFFKKDWGHESRYLGINNRTLLIGFSAAFGIGFYDGFFGPGTGSFLIFAFLLIGFDFLRAAANAKVLNFTSNIASVFVFAYSGVIYWQVALPMGAAMILGALVGTRVAIRNGAAYVRPLFLAIVVLMIGRQLWDVLVQLMH